MARQETQDRDRLSYSERDLDEHGILSRTTRWRLRREGRFPEPQRIGGRLLYIGQEIREWLLDPGRWRGHRSRASTPRTGAGGRTPTKAGTQGPERDQESHLEVIHEGQGGQSEASRS